MRRIALATAAALVAVAPAAHAAGWSGPARFSGGASEPAPRTAIAGDGTSMTVWRRDDGALVAAAGERHGRLAAPLVVTRRVTSSFAVAADTHERAAVAYEARDGLHVAVRQGRGFSDHAIASTGSEINGVQIAADPSDGWVVAERQFPRKGSGVPYRVRVVTLGDGGRPTGPVQDLGEGHFGIEARAAKQLVVLRNGRAVLAYQAEGRNAVLLSTRPRGGTFSPPAEIAGELADPAVTASGNHAFVSAVQAASCGDAGCAGAPVVSTIAPDGTASAPAGPALAHPNRAFEPTAGPGTLAFLLKDAPKPFSREAGVSAFGGGAVQRLTREPSTEPYALKLLADTLVLWATRTGFGAAKASAAGGRFHLVAGPPGPPPSPFHTNATNRDFASAGWYAIAAWARAGTVRVSVRRF
jgi:hypothetical protein